MRRVLSRMVEALPAGPGPPGPPCRLHSRAPVDSLLRATWALLSRSSASPASTHPQLQSQGRVSRCLCQRHRCPRARVSLRFWPAGGLGSDTSSLIPSCSAPSSAENNHICLRGTWGHLPVESHRDLLLPVLCQSANKFGEF